MAEVVNFPAPARELLVVRIFKAPSPELYTLAILDPRIGELKPYQQADRNKIKKLVSFLAVYAEERNLDFEVHDFSSEMELSIYDNDNGGVV